MGLGPWIDLETDPLPGPQELPSRCDVAVIGGGLAGVSCALFLARAGVDVVLLEGHPVLGWGRIGRDPGNVEPGLLEHPCRTIAALGDDRARALLQLAEDNLDLLDELGLLDRCGSVWASLDDREPDEVEQSAEALTRLGFQAEVWSASEADRRTGAFNFGPALFRPTGGRLDPAAAIPTLAEQARRAGATLVGGAWVDRIDEGSEVVLESGERLACEAVVIAAGAGSAALEPALEGRLTPVREQGLVTSPIFAYYPLSGRAGHGYTSYRQLSDGQLVVTGCRWATPHLEVGEDDDQVIVDRIQTKLESFFRLHFKAAEEAEVTDRWAWVFAQTNDGLPFLGPLPGSPTRVACCGFGGAASGLSVVGARAVARGLLDGMDAVPRFLHTVRMVRWRAER